jgi:hypothetical protein
VPGAVVAAVNTPADDEVPIFKAFHELFGTSTKKGRGPAKATLALRDIILDVLDSDAGPWTVRQLFYACSVRGAVEKSEAGYRQAQRQVLLMRREGLIDYSVIADNTRWMRKPATFDSLDAWVKNSMHNLRLDLWRDSDARVEVWCEKDALAGVLYDITGKWHVPLMVTRGYSSETFAYGAAENINDDTRTTYIYYVGDFDPSGVNAAEDLDARLRGFLDDEDKLVFTRLAVTPEQIKEWNLPARPTKTTDTRYKDFKRRYGNVESTELDSIPPSDLRQLVEDAIVHHIDGNQVKAIEAEEFNARELVKKTFGQVLGGAAA